MVRLKQERSKELFEPFEREAGLMPFSFDVTVEFAEEHLVHRAKKSFNPTPSLGLARGREHKACLEIDCNLFYVLRGETRTIVCIKNLRNAADMPVRMPLPPDTLPKGEGRSQRRRWIEAKIIASDRAPVGVDYYLQPRSSGLPVFPNQENAQLRMIRLPDGVRSSCLTPVNQIKAFAI